MRTLHTEQRESLVALVVIMIKFYNNVENYYRKQRIWLSAIKIGAFLVMGLEVLLTPVFWILSRKAAKKIPAIDDEIFKKNATTLARMIRKKEVTSEEVVRKYIQRINKVNPIINAVVQDRFTEAIHEATKTDEWLKTTLLSLEEIEKDYPLLGVPITVKESCKLKGLSFCVGINTRKGMKADDDGEAVRRAKEAGAIPLLVSNTPEVCFGIESDNLVTGRCNNPYNTNYTCGGSSGGEGALLGSACSILGIGSDLACSIRLPALYNGVFGHKPTESLVPNKDHYPCLDDENFKKFLVVGPMARYAQDLRLLLKVIADNKIDFSEKVNLKDVNVYYSADSENLFFINNVSKEVKTAIRKSVRHLKNHCGCKVYNRKLFDLERTFEMSLVLNFAVKNKPDLLQDQNDPSIRHNLLFEFLRLLVNKSTLSYNSLGYDFMVKVHSLLSIQNNDCYFEMLQELKFNLTNTLGSNGILLFPTMPDAAFKHGTSLFNAIGICYSLVFNVLGFPATHVPMGLNQKGLPIGMQVVAAPYRDALCLSVAEELDERFGGWVPPPS